MATQLAERITAQAELRVNASSGHAWPRRCTTVFVLISPPRVFSLPYKNQLLGGLSLLTHMAEVS